MKRASFRGLETVAALAADAAALFAALAVAAWLRFGADVPALDREALRALVPLLAITRLGSFFAAGIYRRSFLHPRGFDYADLVQAWASGTVLFAAAVFFGRALETSRLVLAYEAAANLVLCGGWRFLLTLAGRHGRRPRPAAWIGPAERKERVNRFLEVEGWEFRVTRAVASAAEWTRGDEEAVFVEASEASPELFARCGGLRLVVVAGTREILISGATPVALGGIVVMESGGVRNDRHFLASKRALDILVSCAGLLLAAPLVLAVALAVRLTSPGPVFFTQLRAGIGGRPFSILKFRTMTHGAAGPRLTTRGDARVTGVGRFLRSWSLDELPQLVNVLLGNMSLVGPRPELPELAAEWPEWRRAVLEVQPGLTGLVQVLGRDELSEEEKGRLDLFYAMNRSLEMDVSILLRTLRAVVKYRGRA